MDIFKQFNLPSYLKGKTFAEASKYIEKKFMDRTDKYSMETKEIFMKRLAEAQEYSKMKEQEKYQQEQAQNINTQEGVPQEQNIPEQSVPQQQLPPQGPQGIPGQQQLMAGGFTEKGLGALGAGLNLGNMVFGQTGIETNGNADYTGQKANIGGSTASGALTGLQAGAALGPLAAGVGAVVGGAAGFIGGKRRQNDIKEANLNNALAENAMYNNQYEMGGYTNNKYNYGGYTNQYMGGDFLNRTPPSLSNPSVSTEQINQIFAPRQGNDEINYAVTPSNGPAIDDGPIISFDNFNKPQGTNFQTTPPRVNGNVNNSRFNLSDPRVSNQDIENTFKPNSSSNESSNSNGSISDGVRRTINEALRLSPIAANAYQLADLDRPDQESRARLNNRYIRDNRDERSTINTINNNFNSSFAKEGSGGSLSSFLANRQAAELNKLRAIDQGVKSDDQINRRENQVAQRFNLGVDQTNIQQSNLEDEINDRNEGAYDTQRSRLIGALGTNIGGVGREQFYKDQVKASGLCYDTSGAYICGSDERLTPEQAEKYKNKDETNENARGGMLTSNKMFTSYLDYLKKK